MTNLRWLTAQPIAHRGLHDAANGIIENTPSAIKAAIAGNYAIEVDVQITADGEAMVHHDDELGRLTDGAGKLADLSSAELRRVPFKATADRMISLAELCELVAGRVPLAIELKSHLDGDRRLVTRTAQVLSGYSGHAAMMSFDPLMVEVARDIAPALPRGIVSETGYGGEWRKGTRSGRFDYLRHAVEARPHFIAYNVKHLPAIKPVLARWILGLPLLTWTVRSDADRACAARWADQIIFEGFRP